MIATRRNVRTVGLASFRCFPGILSIKMGPLERDELDICSRDEEEISDIVCLLRSSSSGNAGVLSVVNRLDWRGLDYWKGIVWDPGIVDKRCLHVCYDCLCLIALFCNATICVHDWAALSMWIRTMIRHWRTITWESACLGSIYPAHCMARFFGRNGGEIKDFVTVMMPSGAEDMLFLLSACLRGTSGSVIRSW